MKKPLVAFLLIAAIGTSALLYRKTQTFQTPDRKPSEAELAKAFPGDSRVVFEQSDQFILYSIKPHTAPNRTGTFHDYPIVGQMQIKDKKIKADLIAHFYDGMADENIMSAACFNPHHAIRAMRGKKVVDLVICFSCSGVQIYYAEEMGRTNVSETPERFFNHVLTNANIPLSY